MFEQLPITLERLHLDVGFPSEFFQESVLGVPLYHTTTMYLSYYCVR